jgi:hypothetical protein
LENGFAPALLEATAEHLIFRKVQRGLKGEERKGITFSEGVAAKRLKELRHIFLALTTNTTISDRPPTRATAKDIERVGSILRQLI